MLCAQHLLVSIVERVAIWTEIRVSPWLTTSNRLLNKLIKLLLSLTMTVMTLLKYTLA